MDEIIVNEVVKYSDDKCKFEYLNYHYQRMLDETPGSTSCSGRPRTR